MPTVTPRAKLLFALCGLLVGAIRVEQLADANVLWETRDGLAVLSSGHLPHRDAWSWTVAGRSWTPNSWGWDVLLGAVHRVAGAAGLAALDIALTTALFAVLATAATRRGAGLGATLAMVGAVGGAVFMPWVIVRPQLVGYLLIAAVLPLARRVMGADRRSLPGLLAVTFAGEALWVNLHLFAVVGPVLMTAACLGVVIEQRHGMLRVVAAALVSVAACGLTPYGPVASSKALAVHHDVGSVAVEWRPPGFATYSQFTAVIALLVAVGALRVACRRRDFAAVAVLVVLGLSTVAACRVAPALAVVALPQAAVWLSGGRLRLRGAQVVAAVLVAIGVGVFAVGLGHFGRLATPSDSATLVRKLPHACRTLNDYQLGGSLILFRPDVKVSVDSRTDLYGSARIEGNAAWLASSSLAARRALDKQRVNCVVALSSAPLISALAHDGAWRKAGADGARTLYVRR
jgi:hypothetical protein